MSKKSGFTLIEMLVVIAIIGLLSSVVVIGLTGAREKARDSRRITDINQIQNKLELSYSAQTGYPTALPADVPQTDPQNKPYKYETANNNFSYKLGICLETPESDNTNGFTDTSNCPSTLLGCSYAYCVTPD